MSAPNGTIYWVLADVSEKNAGYRVRVKPLTACASDAGLAVRVISEKELADNIVRIGNEAALVISSKPTNTDVFLCLKYLARKGVRVVVDLFDNYYSWSPLNVQNGVFWHWLRAFQVADSYYVSTPFLSNVLKALGVADITVIPDPLPQQSDPTLAMVEADRGKWSAIERIELLWFGINGNPFYQAGLEDLLSWMRVIQEIASMLDERYDVRLTICTKRVPEVEQCLRAFHEAGIPTRFVEWSDESCDQLLQAAHVILIPSSLSGFALSKSHNRCSDGLANACLVMSSPGGPYGAYGGAVCSTVEQLCEMVLCADVATIKAAIQLSLSNIRSESAATLQRLTSTMNGASGKPSCANDASARTAVFLVAQCRLTTVKFARTLGYWVASFEGSGLVANYDIFLNRVQPGENAICLKFSERAWDHFTSLMLGNPVFEWRGSRTQFSLTKDSWNFAFDRAQFSCVIDAPEFAWDLPPLPALGSALKQESHLDAFWYAHFVGLLVRVIQELGATDIDFGGDGGLGWSEFAAGADADLARSAQHLAGLWQSHLGNELHLGRIESGEAHAN